jgi:hypothetical protein
VNVQVSPLLKEHVEGIKDVFLFREKKAVSIYTGRYKAAAGSMERIKDLISEYKRDVERVQICGQDSLIVFFFNQIILGVRTVPGTDVSLLTFVVRHLLGNQHRTENDFRHLKKVKGQSAEEFMNGLWRKDQFRVHDIPLTLSGYVTETVYFKEQLRITTSESSIQDVLKALAACTHTGTVYILHGERFHTIILEDGNLKEAFFWEGPTILEGIEAFCRIFSIDEEVEVVVLEKREYPFGEWFIFLADALFEKFSQLYGNMLAKKMEKEVLIFLRDKNYHDISLRDGHFHVTDTFKVNTYPQYCVTLRKQLSFMQEVMGISVVQKVCDSLLSELDDSGQFFFKEVLSFTT